MGDWGQLLIATRQRHAAYTAVEAVAIAVVSVMQGVLVSGLAIRDLAQPRPHASTLGLADFRPAGRSDPAPAPQGLPRVTGGRRPLSRCARRGAQPVRSAMKSHSDSRACR